MKEPLKVTEKRRHNRNSDDIFVKPSGEPKSPPSPPMVWDIGGIIAFLFAVLIVGSIAWAFISEIHVTEEERQQRIYECVIDPKCINGD